MSESSLTTSFETLRPEKDPQIFEAVEQMTRGLQAGLGQLAETAGRSAIQGLARHLVHSLARLDDQRTQADLLNAFLEESRQFATRTAFFLAKPEGLSCWAAAGFDQASALTGVEVAYASSAAWTELSRGEGVVQLSADDCRVLSDLVGAPDAARGILVPFVLRGQLSGALYADHLEDGTPLSTEFLQILTHVASQELETLTVRGASRSPALRVATPSVESEPDAEGIAADSSVPSTEAPSFETPSLETPSLEAPSLEAPSLEVEALDPEPVQGTEEVASTDLEEGVESAPVADLDFEDEDQADLASDDLEADGKSTDSGLAAAATLVAGGVVAAVGLADDEDEEPSSSASAGTSFETSTVIAPDVSSDEKVAEASPAFEAPAVEKPNFETPAIEAPPAFEPVPALEEPAFEAAEEPTAVPGTGFDPDAIEVDDSLLNTAVGPSSDAFGVESTSPEATSFEPATLPSVEPPAIEVDAEPHLVAPDFDTAATPVYKPEPAVVDEAPLEVEEASGSEDLDDTASSLWDLEEEDEDVTAVTAVQPPPEVIEETPPIAASELPTSPSFAVPGDAIGQQTVRLNVAALQNAGGVTPDSPPPAVEPQAPPWATEPSSAASEDPTLLVSRSEIMPSLPDATAPPTLAPPVAEVPTAVPPPVTPVSPPPESAVAPPSSAVTPPPPSAGGSEVRPPDDVQGPGSAFGGGLGQLPEGEEALHQEARRLARLLVSEIKLYNEDVIEAGRRDNNIYERLKDDIDRSRQMYDARIDERIRRSEDYFYQELVQRLAGGNATLLGNI